MTAETSNARGEWPERYACNGPEGTFWTDDAALANKLIAAAFDRDEWTVTDTQNPTGAAPQPAAARGDWVLERLRGVLEHGKMGDKCLIAPDLVTAAIAALSAPQPPAEAQPVAKLVNRKDSDGGKTTTFIRPTSLGMDLPLGEYPLHLHPPPSAPVGVEDVVMAARNAENAIRNCAAAGQIGEGYVQYADDLRDAVQRLAQQPAAGVGEEIMVNAAHDVYTLPLQPSGLLSGPRFVVHVPAPEQQPAAVDDARSGSSIMDGAVSFVEALTTQHQEPKS